MSILFSILLEQRSRQDGTSKDETYAEDSWHLSTNFAAQHFSTTGAHGLHQHDKQN
jgi:hypothetical protein